MPVSGSLSTSNPLIFLKAWEQKPIVHVASLEETELACATICGLEQISQHLEHLHELGKAKQLYFKKKQFALKPAIIYRIYVDIVASRH